MILDRGIAIVRFAGVKTATGVLAFGSIGLKVTDNIRSSNKTALGVEDITG